VAAKRSIHQSPEWETVVELIQIIIGNTWYQVMVKKSGTVDNYQMTAIIVGISN
jgi:hypothetical protein